MRNLIRIHCKRFWFRWETFAVTMLNLLLAVICFLAASFLYESGSIRNNEFFSIMRVTTIISVAFTLAAVIFIEINTLATGAIRNSLIAGYTKTQVFLSKFIAVGVFSIVQGTLFLLPPMFANKWIDLPVQYVVSMLLVYIAVSCIAMTVCLVSDRPTIYVVVCIGCLIGLMFGGRLIAVDLSRSRYSYIDIEQGTLVTEDNMWYVSSPKREILEQCIRFNPVQPIEDYCVWYFENINSIRFSIDNMKRAEGEVQSEVEKEKAQLVLKEIEDKYQLYMKRMQLFPIYQTVFLLLLAGGGAVIFRKRNIK